MPLSCRLEVGDLGIQKAFYSGPEHRLKSCESGSQPSMLYKFHHLRIDVPQQERDQLKERVISFLFPSSCLSLLFPLVKSDLYFFPVNTPRVLQLFFSA